MDERSWSYLLDEGRQDGLSVASSHLGLSRVQMKRCFARWNGHRVQNTELSVTGSSYSTAALRESSNYDLPVIPT